MVGKTVNIKRHSTQLDKSINVVLDFGEADDKLIGELYNFQKKGETFCLLLPADLVDEGLFDLIQEYLINKHGGTTS